MKDAYCGKSIKVTLLWPIYKSQIIVDNLQEYSLYWEYVYDVLTPSSKAPISEHIPNNNRYLDETAFLCCKIVH